MIIAYVLAAISGLLGGSFINAWIYRMEKNESVIFGRSKCPHCGKKLGPLELIPIFSFLLQKGRCRGCQKDISWVYPVGEAATALLFLLIAWRHTEGIAISYCDISKVSLGIGVLFLRDAIFVVFLSTLFIFDLKHKLVPDQAVIPAIVVAFVWNMLGGMPLNSLLIGIAVGGGFFFLQYVISKGKWIGDGDIRIGLMMGAMLGWPGVLPAIFISYILGSVISVLLLLTKKASWKTAVPFGTFLTVGTLIILLWGNEILAWYNGLTGLMMC